MEVAIGIVVGVLTTFIIMNKTFKIEVTHVTKYDNPQSYEGYDMSEVMAQPDKEDQAYDDMGQVIADINKLMSGGVRRGEE